MGGGPHSNGQPTIAQRDHGENPGKTRLAWTGEQGESVDGLRGRRPPIVRDLGWGGMENCGIRSLQVLGNSDGGGSHV